MNDAQIWVQFEFEGVKAKGQSLPDGFQRRFLETPELEESPQALKPSYPFNSIRFGSRKIPMGQFYSLQIPRLILDIDADPMYR